MQIYIASSWRNQHAVDLLAYALREEGVKVDSFVERAKGRAVTCGFPPSDDGDWLISREGEEAFTELMETLKRTNMVIYVGPSGPDAWAEVGVAYGQGKPVWGLWAKGEPIGLNRHMVGRWFKNFRALRVALFEARFENNK